MEVANLRITKLRDYLLDVIKAIKNVEQISANMLSANVDNYSLDRIPTQSKQSKWIDGTEIHRDVYSFRSRCAYSQDTINNLKNIGFFEILEQTINSNNKQGIRPENVDTIECLNTGSLVSADSKTAEFDIQIAITYRV